jgi:hypothetical protein
VEVEVDVGVVNNFTFDASIASRICAKGLAPNIFASLLNLLAETSGVPAGLLVSEE